MQDLSYTASLNDAMSGVAEAIAEALQRIADVMEELAAAVTSGMEESAAATEALAGSVETLSGSVDSLALSVDANTTAVDANTTALGENNAAADTGAGAHSKLASAAKGAVMPLAIGTAAVVAIGAAAIHMAGDFQAGLDTLVTGAGESASNLSTIHDGILRISDATGESTSQLISGMFMIESAGHHGQDALNVLQAASEGAKVGAADLGVVANGTTTILTDFASTGINADQAVNSLIATVSQGKTHMQDLAQSFAQILPTASAAGISLYDVEGALATMTGEGVPAANAATYLRQTIIALEAPSKQTTTALKSVGLTTKQVADAMHESLPDALKMITDAVGKKFPEGSAAYVQALKEISGGSKQMQGMLDLTGQHMHTFVQDTVNISGAAVNNKTTVQGWALVQQSFNQQMSEAGAKLETLFIKFGEALMPVATALIQHLQPALAHLSDWIGAHGAQAAQGFGVLAAVLGGALSAALLVVAADFIIANAAALPFIALGAGLAGIAALLLVAYHNSQPFHDAVNGMVTAISHWRDGLRDVEGALHAAQTPLEIVGGVLTAVFLPALIQTGIQAAAAGVSMVVSLVPSLIAATGSFITMATTAIVSAVSGLITYAAAGWAAAAATIAATWPILLIIAAVAALAIGIYELVTHWKQVSAFLESVWSTVVHGVGAGFSWLGTQAHNLWNTITGAFNAGVAFVVGLARHLVQDIVAGFEWLYNHNYFFQALVDAIRADFALAQRIISAVWSAITGFLTAAWSGIVALAKANWNMLTNDVRLAFHLVQTYIIGPVTAVANWLNAQAARILGFLRAAWNTVVSDVSSAWSRVVGAITSAGGHVTGAVSDNIISPLTHIISGLITTAEGWGKQLLQMFIKGIQSQIGAVTSVAGNIAGGIAKMLGFHSPAEEGPASTADEWMPNLGKMLASGLQEQARPIGAAASAVAGAVAGALGSPTATAPTGAAALLPPGAVAGMAGYGSAAAAGPLQVTVILKDETGMGGFIAGTRLLDPSVMRAFAQQVAQEIAQQGFLQGRQPIGYTGSK